MERPTLGDGSGRPGGDPHWVKSSLSFSNGNCVEVANLPGGQVGVRHSKHTEGLVLRFTPGPVAGVSRWGAQWGIRKFRSAVTAPGATQVGPRLAEAIADHNPR